MVMVNYCILSVVLLILCVCFLFDAVPLDRVNTTFSTNAEDFKIC